MSSLTHGVRVVKTPTLPADDDDDFSAHDYRAAQASFRRAVESWQHAEELRRWVEIAALLGPGGGA